MLGIGAFSIALFAMITDRVLLITLDSSAAACTVAILLGERRSNKKRVSHILAAIPCSAMLDFAITRWMTLLI